MRRALLLVVLAAASATIAACEEKGDNANNRPDSPPMSPPPLAPDPGTYSGLETRPSQRPPRSGLNADPSNPNGAPGTGVGPNITR
jgi:hypothetical protein